MSEVEYPPGARFLEIGSGSGAVTRALACRPGVAEAIGVDPSSVFVSKAQDPLQQCVEAAKAAFINDVWLVRRLPALLRSRGFEILSSRSYSYLQTSDPEYMLTLVDRGADALVSSGRIGTDLCASLKAEARRRAGAEEFFGFIGFASFVARKPLSAEPAR